MDYEVNYGYEEEEENFDMYQDEYYDGEGVDTDSDITSTTKQKKRRLWNDSLVDKSFHKIKVGKKTIGIYSSSVTPGFTIKNAVTGSYCEDKVGSLYEHLYYKIKIATGEVGRESATFFFDSPEQCERHLGSDIPQDTKAKWHNKYLQAKRELLDA